MRLFIASLMIVLVLDVLTTSAQDIVKKGYIVTTAKDTVKGYIYDLEWEKSPVRVDFKAGESQEKKTYGVLDLNSFGTDDGTIYESRDIEFDGEHLDKPNKELPRTREPATLTRQRIFIKRLVTGLATLFKFVDKNEINHYFIQYGDKPLEELRLRKYVSTKVLLDYGIKHEEEVITDNRRYIQQLINYFSDCLKLSSVEYNDRNLTKLFVQYDECKGGYKPAKAVEKISKKPIVGILLNPFMVHMESKLAAGTSMGPIHFGAGVSVEFFSKKRPNRVSFYNEIKYRNATQSGQSHYPSAPGPTFTTNVTTKLSEIRMVSMLRVSYPLKSTRIFWNGGVIVGPKLSSDVTYSGMSAIDSQDKMGWDAGIALGAGAYIFNMKSFKGNVELRYEYAFPLSSNNGVGGSGSEYNPFSYLGLILGIQF